MGVAGEASDSTICGQGCAMSCLSMALNRAGIEINGQPSNPGSLNAWLRKNDGYECVNDNCNNLVLTAVETLAPDQVLSLGEPSLPFDTTLATMVTNLETNELAAFAHVMTGDPQKLNHFVYVTGVKSSASGKYEFYTNDPGYNQTSYAYADMRDVLLYNIRDTPQ
jgi:hypothetical protein